MLTWPSGAKLKQENKCWIRVADEAHRHTVVKSTSTPTQRGRKKPIVSFSLTV